jgi:hypothetical protein
MFRLYHKGIIRQNKKFTEVIKYGLNLNNGALSRGQICNFLCVCVCVCVCVCARACACVRVYIYIAHEVKFHPRTGHEGPEGE